MVINTNYKWRSSMNRFNYRNEDSRKAIIAKIRERRMAREAAQTEPMNRKAEMVGRSKMAEILNVTADAMNCIEKAEVDEGVTTDTKMARKDLSAIVAELAELTEKFSPESPRAMHALKDIENRLAKFPR
jgi:DNA-binding XRE family transcriptional regulator